MFETGFFDTLGAFKRMGMNRSAVVLGVLAFLALTASAPLGYGREKTFFFSVFGSLGFSLAEGTSRYADNWDGAEWRNIREHADISYRAGNGAFFGGAFTFMFNRNFGVQLGGGVFGRNMPNDIVSGWEANLGAVRYDDEYAFTGAGKLSSVPVFLNIVGRHSTGRMDISLSAGPTLFLSKAEAEATGIYGQSFSWSQNVPPAGWILYEELDFLPVAMNVPPTFWAGLGANIGLGIDFNLSPKCAVFMEARYFLCGSRELDWEYLSGIYDGSRGIFNDWAVAADDIDYLMENKLTTPLKVNPSFFAIGAGFKVRI
ncbi:MAG: hypothetical protein A2Y56_08160 [Candidatus Aminicenantes bacterium RBG_13_63_10]|nr:MAG: hypothetical protein A2Y56_08160 [Candidatus Aminicenantes bacterium RBG_13_63_10]